MRTAWLAGEVLLEAGVERASRSQQGRDLLARARARLAALLEGGRLAPRERADAGDVLGRLGDPRRGVARLPGDAARPDFLWVEIPAGPFLMGSRKGERDAFSNEHPQHRVDVPYRYWMSRYPVTVAQYACFVEAGGYESPDWWTAVGWAWRRGEWDSQVEEKWLRDYLGRRSVELRGAPMEWGEQQENPNRPVMNVSWFEATAYCRWVTGQEDIGNSSPRSAAEGDCIHRGASAPARGYIECTPTHWGGAQPNCVAARSERARAQIHREKSAD